MNLQLEGRRALVTGSSAGIGEGIARALALEGVTVVVHGRNQERAEHTVYPPPEDVFNAFKATPYKKVKVLLLGQDPYHGPGQAHGMCFSVRPGVRPPPSLVNMFKELRDDLGCKVPNNGCLQTWAERGVMLASLGGLFSMGAAVRWEALYPRGGHCVRLPAYPWPGAQSILRRRLTNCAPEMPPWSGSRSKAKSRARLYSMNCCS